MAAFPPGFTKEEAIEILAPFASYNRDGTGSVYLQNDKFVVNKWPIPFEDVLRKNLPLLDHMPCSSWTLVHLRAASHGANTVANTHPIIKGNWAMTHNGIFGEYYLLKTALSKIYKFDGETDSEPLVQLFDAVGPRQFFRAIKNGGVYFFLRKTGRLYVYVTRGDLEFQETPRGIVLASSLPSKYSERNIVRNGWIRFSGQGRIMQSSCTTAIQLPEKSYKVSTFFAQEEIDQLPKQDKDLLLGL